jgi:hypothetical protein
MYAKYECSPISFERVIDRKGNITSVELLKADLNGFFMRHTFHPSSTCVPNIKAVVFDLTEL